MYLNTFFMVNLLAFLPLDYFMMAVKMSDLACGLVRVRPTQLLRLLKLPRVYKLLMSIKKDASKNLVLFKLTLYLLSFVYLSHLTACVFFIVAKIQYRVYPNARFDGRCFIQDFGKRPYNYDYSDLLSMSVSDQYIQLAYFGFALVATVAYGDMFPLTVAEIITTFTFMIISKFLVAIIFAETAAVLSTYHEPFTEHLQRLQTIKSWMVSQKLPSTLQNRVVSYYDLLWRKLRGHDDATIMSNLPESLCADISLVLFNSFSQSKMFPAEEQGAILAILKRCKVKMVCKDEFIVLQGELGLEMYFIIDGEVEIISGKGVILNTIGKGEPFGEMALLSEKPTLRGASVKAKTDVSMAVLSLSDFKYVMEKFPEFAEKVKAKANSRSAFNKRAIKRLSVMPVPMQVVAEADDDELESSSSEESDFEDSPQIVPSTSPDTISAIPRQLSLTPFSLIESFSTEVKMSGGRMLPRLLGWFKVHEYSFSAHVVFFTMLYNVFFIPIQIAYEVEFKGFTLTAEVLTLVVLITKFVMVMQILLNKKKTEYRDAHPHYVSMSNSYLMSRLFFTGVAAMPFALVFDLCQIREPRFVVVIFSLLRLVDCRPLFVFFKYLKKRRMSWLNMIRIVEAVFIYYSIAHLCACMFVETAKIEDDDDLSWFRRLPVLQVSGVRTASSDSISATSSYIHSLNFIFVTFSHIGVGDVTSVTNNERIFNCFILTIAVFVFALSFGNMTSLVSALALQSRQQLHVRYRYVLGVLQKKNLAKKFMKRINDYFNYLWETNQGLDEVEVLADLPSNLAADIQLARYSHILHKSLIVKNSAGEVDIAVARSLMTVMKIKYFMIGEHVVQANDKCNDMFLLLDGEVQVTDMSGTIVLATLKAGDHFGEANLLFNWTNRRTASVSCTDICKIGVIDNEAAKNMLAAFPSLHSTMLTIAKERMSKTFDAQDFEAMALKLSRLARRFSALPITLKESVINRESLIAPRVAEILSMRPKTDHKNFELFHLAMLLYSAFSIPFQISFDLDLTVYWVVMEVVCSVESIIFLILNCRLAVLIEGRKTMSVRDILSYYYNNMLAEDLIAISPFNLILWASQVKDPIILVSIVRLLRLISLTRVMSLIEKIELRYREYSHYFTSLGAVLLMVGLWHWCGCFWYFVNNFIEDESEITWIDYWALDETSVWEQYLYTMYFIMNLVSTVGYGDMFGMTDTERAVICLIISIGDGLFAFAFGLMSALAAGSESELQQYLERVKAAIGYLSGSSVPKSLMTRLEQYYAYQWAITQKLGLLSMDKLYEFLPVNMVDHIIFEVNKNLIRSLTMIAASENEALMEQIAVCLNPEIFLPLDYLIYKVRLMQNDIGQEMYFLIEGSVNIISPDNKRILKTLEKGDYFGELALLNETKRICSIIANTFCFVYVLQKADFDRILISFPEIREVINKQSQLRFEETNLRHEIQGDPAQSFESEDSDISGLNSEDFNSDERSLTFIVEQALKFNQILGGPTGSSNLSRNLNMFSGLKNMQKDSIFEKMQETAIERKKLRRPHAENAEERRLSQLSLGRELVLSRFTNLKMQWTMQGK